MQNKTMLILFSILAGLQVLAGGAALGDIIGDQTMGLFVLVVGAFQAGLTVFVRGQIPLKDVAAYVPQHRRGLVAGPAANAPAGEAVHVEREDPTLL